MLMSSLVDVVFFLMSVVETKTITPLFATMLAPPAVVEGEGGGDSLEWATTTASLDAQQDSSNITKTQSKETLNEPTPQGEGLGSGPGGQETIGGAMAQIRSEGSLIQSIDPSLSTELNEEASTEREQQKEASKAALAKMYDEVPAQIDADHDLAVRLTLEEQEKYTVKERQDVLDLHKIIMERFLANDTEGYDLILWGDLKIMVESNDSSMSINMFVEKRYLLTKEILVKMLSSRLEAKTENIKDVLDEDVDIEMIVEDKGNGEKGGSTAETVSTARPDISAARLELSTAEPKTPLTTTTLFDDEDVTIVDTLIQAELNEEASTEREQQKEASKAALAKMYDEVPAQIDADHDLAVRLTLEEQEKYTVKERSKLLAEFFERRKKQLAKERAEAKPNHTWGSNATDISSSSSLVMTVRFGNDHIARIIGYGDYQLGNVTISRVYYVKGLRHNLFSVGQFCDADLKVAFRKNTCFIPSKTKSWLWHRQLSHLNFGTINKLAKDGLARGILRLKFQKDHLCSACALGKSKKSSHQPKAKDTNQEKLYLLHMDLCGPMRVASINGKSNVRTDKETKFVNQTLRECYENVGISHQTSVARTPQQNSVVKRRNRTLIEAARIMLIFSKVLLFLWAEAINTACYTQNRSLIRLRYNKPHISEVVF
nr:hypothetical protein [Tanacetum cinerariifolium]